MKFWVLNDTTHCGQCACTHNKHVEIFSQPESTGTCPLYLSWYTLWNFNNFSQNYSGTVISGWFAQLLMRTFQRTHLHRDSLSAWRVMTRASSHPPSFTGNFHFCMRRVACALFAHYEHAYYMQLPVQWYLPHAGGMPVSRCNFMDSLGLVQNHHWRW